ncbi:carboxypeptidase-like regulatory domain-containing protein [uncultured Fluviicola sp.]|uniref:carboxypeptidase-like regulatory domain-containing protein n=1 Tax=uncultured Fluviicola sp. TaxID=463303 RepID=UPI0025CE63FF|nr:carboxypeptidase-like regulatory domain-containing protein [uncultured Fluviicola sp.]
MNNWLKYGLIGMVIAISLNANSQKDERLIQLSGVVVSSDSLQEMPYAGVYNKTTRRGTIADIYGFFSLVVHPSDTIMFRYYGHKPSSYIVPDTLSENRYSIIHMMTVDTIQLSEVVIYPWPSKEAFAQAFVEMNPYDDAMLRAQKELSGQSLAQIASLVPNDASLSFGNVVNQNNTRLYTMGQSPVNNLLNPFAWATFLQKWRSGELRRQ